MQSIRCVLARVFGERAEGFDFCERDGIATSLVMYRWRGSLYVWKCVQVQSAHKTSEKL